MRKKTLKGIKPFNDFWFRSCYYHQLISGLSKFNVPPAYTLLNYAVEIFGCDSWENLGYEERSVLTDSEYTELTGVETYRYSSSNLTADVIKSVNRNSPIIVGQDNYTLPYRSEYNSLHGPHFLLIYGYDLSAETFTAYEHSFVSGLDFCERKIPIYNVKVAHESFAKNCKNFDWTVEEFSKRKSDISFLRRLELEEKLRRSLCNANLMPFMLPYELLKKSDTVNKKIRDVFIFFAKYFRTLMSQYEIFCGKSKIDDELRRIWQCSHFMQGIAVKSDCYNSTELYHSQIVKDKINEMKCAAERFGKSVKRL